MSGILKSFPNEIQQYIHTFIGEKEENMKKFSQYVLPSLLIEIILKELSKFQKNIPEGKYFIFSKSKKNNKQNFIEMHFINPTNLNQITEIMNIEIYIHNIHMDFAPILQLFGFEFYSLNDFTEFLIDHWIDNQPFPIPEEFNQVQFINYLDPDELDNLIDDILEFERI